MTIKHEINGVEVKFDEKGGIVNTDKFKEAVDREELEKGDTFYTCPTCQKVHKDTTEDEIKPLELEGETLPAYIVPTKPEIVKPVIRIYSRVVEYCSEECMTVDQL